MKEDGAIKVIAADVMTGTLLDEQYEWFIGKSGQAKWMRSFGNRAEATAFCETEVQNHPNVEFWLQEDGGDGLRIVNAKWRR